MRLPVALNAARFIVMIAVFVFIWITIGMVYVDRFFPPFECLAPYLTPWKGLDSIPADTGLTERLAIMEGLLNASTRVSTYAFFAMVGSFALFSGYLTFVYQQRQRRTQENRLLVLKNQEIARRNEFIRYISATIGHEFKNNLGRIKRRMDLLPDLPPEAAGRMHETFDKLFADIEIFKKIADEREAGLIDFRRVDLKEMLSTLARQYNDMADIVFSDTANHMQPIIFASRTLLRTVFENILDNAVRYKTPEQEKAKIVLSCSMDVDGSRRYVSLSFRDEGLGMDEQQADRCFYASKRSGEGWGRGLYYAKYVVGLHAGKIRVGKEYTKKGQGTEIIVNLPFIEEALDV